MAGLYDFGLVEEQQRKKRSFDNQQPYYGNAYSTPAEQAVYQKRIEDTRQSHSALPTPPDIDLGLRKEIEFSAPVRPYISAYSTPSEREEARQKFTDSLKNKPWTNINSATPINATTPIQSAAQLEPAPTPEAPSNLPQGLMLSPDQQKVASKIMDSVQANPDDPKKWGHPDVIAHETDSGTQMPNGWGVVKDSKGRIHVAPPSRWNFYGDTKAEEQWRDAENAKRASREVTQTLADEAIKARSSFVGPKRRAQAVDSMLGLESLRSNAANAKYSAGLNAALNRQAALEKEGRQRYDNVLTNVFNILKAEKPEADYPGEAGRIMRRIMADESLFAKVNSMNPNETANLASELANQGLIDEHIRKKSGVGKGLNDTYLDWKLKNPSTWFGRKGLYDTDNNFIDLDGLDTEQQRAIFVAKLRQGLIDDVKSGKITEAEALQILNTRLAENGFLIPERVW